jgi:pre-mRNA-splicing factor ATP-dependent RNA helicase DHX15/PRP43
MKPMPQRRSSLYQMGIILHFSMSIISTNKVGHLTIYDLLRLIRPADLYNKNWAWKNYVAQRALAQAENVRSQLQRIMERFEIDLLSLEDEKKLYLNIRKALVCGFFTQVAHKEGEKGSYTTVKDHQVSSK